MRAWTAHPVMRVPTPEEIAGAAARWGVSPYQAYARIWTQREAAIRAMRELPMSAGWEPPAWRLADALLGWPWVDAEQAQRTRRALGFEHPVRVLLIEGGQRGSKSEYAAKAMSRLMQWKKGARVWMLHSNHRMSLEYQQPLMERYLPPELRGRDLRTRQGYVKYAAKTGFSENRFILPNLSDCSFLAYEMDRTTVEGGNVDGINPDELVPSDWVETMRLRIAERDGRMIVTFTPVNGYSDTVRMFEDGAQVVLSRPGLLLPTDGDAPDVAGELGLDAREYERLVEWMDAPDRVEPVSVWGRPEEFTVDAAGRMTTSRQAYAAGSGRKFELVPRVARCADPEGRTAVMWFHSSDNPFGNPLSVWRAIAGGNRRFHRERFYGVADKVVSPKFPRFGAAHIVPASAIPEHGTNYLLVDPCGGRRWFLLWVRMAPGGRMYATREWPGTYPIPGIGVPGPWAVPDGKRMDGRAGEGQRGDGWGLLEYKREIARLEGWSTYGSDAPAAAPAKTVPERRGGARGVGQEQAAAQAARRDYGDLQVVADWDEWCEKREWIHERYLDARFGNTKEFTDGGMKTLFEEFEEIGLTFHPTPQGPRADSIDEGCGLINSLLAYDESRPAGHGNSPRLYVCEDCENLIYAMRTYTGQDGLKGATKDPIDCLRFAVLANLQYLGDRPEAVSVDGGGGVY